METDMTQRFRPGDILECIKEDPADFVQVGKFYVVHDASDESFKVTVEGKLICFTYSEGLFIFRKEEADPRVPGGVKVVLLDFYQQEAVRTASRGTVPGVDVADGRVSIAKSSFDLLVWSLGLAGEAGEFADMMKKHVGHGHPLNRDKAKKELGDVLWYLATLADGLGLRLSDVADSNIEKLRARYPDGFSSERSINRADEKPHVCPRIGGCLLKRGEAPCCCQTGTCE
jgi:NTP pyrophosphatase (non-canonical NTP hydrolase)